MVITSETDSRRQGKRIVAEVLPFIRAVQSPIDRSHFIKIVSEKSGISADTLMEELSRGAVFQTETTKEETITLLPSKERLSREIVAVATLTGKLSDEKVTSLDIDVNQFPDAIIQEEMFKLEEKVVSNKEKYFDDLIKSYKKEVHKEKLIELQHKLKEEGADHEVVLKEIYDHAKKGS